MFNIKEEQWVAKRLADWHEYHSFGFPVGLLKDFKEHGFSKAWRHYSCMRRFVRSEPAKNYCRVWSEEEKDFLGEVKDGTESGYYGYQHPVAHELRCRELHRNAMRPLECCMAVD
jgi:hypothetical protein